MGRTTEQIIIETVDEDGLTQREAILIEVEDSPRPEGTITEVDLVVFQLRAVLLDKGDYGVYSGLR